MKRYEEILQELRSEPRSWLVTGAAGFIGSNLVEALLLLDQHVVGIDNFATGFHRNVQDVLERVGTSRAERLRFIDGDIRDPETCHAACRDVEIVLHNAALGSVPRSIADPVATNATNVDGFLNVLVAARDARVRRFVYAASSSTYGDHPALPKVEERIGRPMSPYAVTKYLNELYAGVFERTYGVQTVGLRYFNVFGRRQDPAGGYAAVIPVWVRSLLAGEPCVINGDGETTRDFCYIDNVLQANILAATVEGSEITDQVYNVACGDRTTLNELFELVRNGLALTRPELASARPEYREFRAADVRHSQADISKIRSRLGYEPTHRVEAGLEVTLDWYAAHLVPSAELADDLADRRRAPGGETRDASARAAPETRNPVSPVRAAVGGARGFGMRPAE